MREDETVEIVICSVANFLSRSPAEARVSVRDDDHVLRGGVAVDQGLEPQLHRRGKGRHVAGLGGVDLRRHLLIFADIAELDDPLFAPLVVDDSDLVAGTQNLNRLLRDPLGPRISLGNSQVCKMIARAPLGSTFLLVTSILTGRASSITVLW